MCDRSVLKLIHILRFQFPVEEMENLKSSVREKRIKCNFQFGTLDKDSRPKRFQKHATESEILDRQIKS